MLSLPEDWNCTLAGLSQINRESIEHFTVLGGAFPAVALLMV